jgi:hypothetical protein
MTVCTEWNGARSSAGYGQKWWDGKVRYVHRLVWELLHGPIPPGMQVLHRCDNPPCYRPDHLFLGTQHDNLVDAGRKGHMARPGAYAHLRVGYDRFRAAGGKVGRKRKNEE